MHILLSTTKLTLDALSYIPRHDAIPGARILVQQAERQAVPRRELDHSVLSGALLIVWCDERCQNVYKIVNCAHIRSSAVRGNIDGLLCDSSRGYVRRRPCILRPEPVVITVYASSLGVSASPFRRHRRRRTLITHHIARQRSLPPALSTALVHFPSPPSVSARPALRSPPQCISERVLKQAC